MKELDGFEGLYSITENGEVFSHRRNKYLSQCEDKYGYKLVKLYFKGGRRISLKVHRLVAETFIENPAGHPLVCHGKLGKQVNTVENLRWGTYSDNRKDAETFNERPTEFVKGSGHGNSKLTDEQVLEIYDLSHNSKLTQSTIGVQYGVGYATVSNIKRGKQWSHITGHQKDKQRC